MNGIVEAEERYERVLVGFLHLLCALLEAGEHGTLTAGEVLAGITVLANFGKDLLHDNKLVRHKWKIRRKFNCAAEAFYIKPRVGKAEEIAQDGVVFGVECFQLLCSIDFLLKDTLLITSSTEEEESERRVLKRA